MFEIDTGTQPRTGAEWSRTPASKDAWAEGNGRIDWSVNPVAAERFHRKFLGRLWSEVDTAEDLDAIMAAEALSLDALWLAFPEYAERIGAAESELRAQLGATKSAPADDPRPAEPGNPTAQSGKDGKDDNDDFFF